MPLYIDARTRMYITKKWQKLILNTYQNRSIFPLVLFFSSNISLSALFSSQFDKVRMTCIDSSTNKNRKKNNISSSYDLEREGLHSRQGHRQRALCVFFSSWQGEWTKICTFFNKLSLGSLSSLAQRVKWRVYLTSYDRAVFSFFSFFIEWEMSKRARG